MTTTITPSSLALVPSLVENTADIKHAIESFAGVSKGGLGPDSGCNGSRAS